MSIAVSTTKCRTNKRVYVAPLRNPTLVAILDAPKRQATSKELDISPAYALVLESGGMIRRVEGVKRPSGSRGGRPPVVWTLTDKGRKRAQRAKK